MGFFTAKFSFVSYDRSNKSLIVYAVETYDLSQNKKKKQTLFTNSGASFIMVANLWQSAVKFAIVLPLP